MKKKIIIHVGSVKTGSSYLQNLFSANRATLDEGDVCYPAHRESSDRFANGNILRDPAFAAQVKALVTGARHHTLIFSEEGLFAGFLSAIPDYFWEHDVRIVAYIRDPVELIAAWAAEHAKPYNSRAGNVLRVEQNIDVLCDLYADQVRDFLGCADSVGLDKVTVRPYARKLFRDGALESDFFHAAGAPELAKLIQQRPNAIVNPTLSRKYCDISALLYEKLHKSDQLYEYNEYLVDAIYRSCKSGDNRPVVETISERVQDIVDRLSWIDSELAQRFPWNAASYINQKHRMFGPALPLQQVDLHELEYRLLRRTMATSASRLIGGFDPYAVPLSDSAISSQVDKAVVALEQQHGAFLKQKTELLKMRRLAEGALASLSTWLLNALWNMEAAIPAIA